ncbi:malate dehydrogenase (quinone) [Nocardia stercoris]|uniref:Probable malate:quinone oxidoreductase n=1 Tax=Nocardia stercoris TaxID=2483361 RepID=A0A3M2L765_9NOCA|nr:malate dehydrogenase (quinone) [Nocardia stercoris]
MSATLGALLATIQPDWSITLFERLDTLGAESSAAWNNAGTGHSGYCELNYMPDPRDATRAAEIARQFRLSRQFWSALTAAGDLPDPGRFVHGVPHLDVVFGDRDVAALRTRHATLRALPLFSAMEYTEDPAVIAEWAPLLMAGRAPGTPMAATRYPAGTDVDFGALTRDLVASMAPTGARIRLRHEVIGLRRLPGGRWSVRVRDLEQRATRTVSARFVFVGAGGYALKLLQRAGIPEVRGHGVFPLGAEFLRCDNPEVVARHRAKVYGQADIGAPPMSVPHLDLRVVDGQESLLFGPYATFSTRLLKRGRLIDLFTTLRPHNLPVLLAAGLHNLDLVGYLFGQLIATRRRKFEALRRFFPDADPADWYPIAAGQRAQLVRPHPHRIGELVFGTELMTSADGSIAGLLGASPGASTATAIMIDLLARCFPRDYPRWEPILHHLLPGLTDGFALDHTAVDTELARTGTALGLSSAANPARL